MKPHTKQSLFLEKLADLCEQYDADFYYTIDDDGIHIIVDGNECFVGFCIGSAHFSKQLRKQSKRC